jgi:dihydroorotate dehydrogenase
MPSRSPDVWRDDIEQTRRRLPRGKILVVSVVGTAQPHWSIDDLARDYALCARWAVESGADAVEANFSCPNVATCDGTLYQQPASAAVVAGELRRAVGDVPLIAKIGHVPELRKIDALLTAIGPHVSGIAMTNSIAAHVEDSDSVKMFGGEPRGICGDATRDASVRQVALFAKRLKKHGPHIALIGVGGIGTALQVRQYLRAGAESVQLATSAMVNPAVALRIRRHWQDCVLRDRPPAVESRSSNVRP